MMTLKERYQNDNHFHALVDMMVAHIQQAQFTPSEMREAAILASIIYEEHNIVHQRFIEVDLEVALRTIRKRLEE